MNLESTFIILFCIASAVAIATQRLRLPYTVALLVAGLFLGALHTIEPPHLTKDLLFAIFLPGLLFEAAFHLDFGEFRKNALFIGALAVPGLILVVLLTALISVTVIGGTGIVPGFTWPAALVFGALIAATDPIAVVSIFRTVNVPTRLSVLVEGESLINDGTSVVVLTLILAYVAGTTPTAVGLGTSFLTITAGGLMIGGAVGILAALVTKRIDDSMIEITLTVIAAYGSFVLAEQLHLSGVIATVAAGMTSGNYARHVGMSPTTRIAVESFWEYVAFALNSAVFLLLGFSVELIDLAGTWRAIMVGFFAVAAARSAVVFAVLFMLKPTRERVPAVWGAVLTWGGLRGALSLVLALALPRDIPFRDILITMTAGVVLTSILAQGITMGPLLRRLGVAGGKDSSMAYETARGDLRLANALLAEIDRMARVHATTSDVLDPIRRAYEERRDRARARMAGLRVEGTDVAEVERLRAVRHLLTIERNALSEASRDGGLGSAVYGKLAASAADRLVRLESGQFSDPAQLLDGVVLD